MPKIINKKENSGQALIAGMALMAVAAVVFFLVFNSSRAVNEKINLVNAADAAAYSGAQIAARQLNFMAHTNRVMVANEVAIGHMVSYQAEVETVTNAFAGMGGIIGSAIITAFNYVGAFVNIDAEDAAAWVQDRVRAVTGVYALGVSANNAAYSEFIKTEYDALLGINGQQPIVENAMSAVAQQYISRPSITISLNSQEGLDAISNSPDPAVAARANDVLGYRSQLCQLIYFATPAQPGDGGFGGNGNGNGNQNPLFGYCQAVTNSNGNASPNTPGGRNSPVKDAGIMLELLDRSSQAAKSSEWITNRNMDYKWGLGWDAERRGATTVEWDAVNDQYNWVAQSDSINVRSLLGFMFNMEGESNPDNNSYMMAQAGQVDIIKLNMMRDSGMCDDIDCDDLAQDASAGHQMIQSYPRINPFSGGIAAITAVLTQSGRCNDTIGLDEAGNEIAGFVNDQTRFDNPCTKEGSMTAVGAAEVFYKTPSGSGAESANLFNPYWQARLAL